MHSASAAGGAAGTAVVAFVEQQHHDDNGADNNKHIKRAGNYGPLQQAALTTNGATSTDYGKR